VRPADSTGLSSEAYAGSWKTVGQSGAAVSSRIAADVGVQAVPDQYDRPAELLVRGVQQPCVVRLGEPFPLVPGPAVVHPVDQTGRSSAGRRSAQRATPGLLWPPVTVTTGVCPHRPQARPFGGLKPWPDSSSKTSQAPCRSAVLL
jgi:hypothetical protein